MARYGPSPSRTSAKKKLAASSARLALFDPPERKSLCIGCASTSAVQLHAEEGEAFLAFHISRTCYAVESAGTALCFVSSRSRLGPRAGRKSLGSGPISLATTTLPCLVSSPS